LSNVSKVAGILDSLARTYGEALDSMLKLQAALVSHDLDNIIKTPGWLDTLAKRAKQLECTRLSLCQEIALSHSMDPGSVDIEWLARLAQTEVSPETAGSIRTSGASLQSLLPQIYETNKANALLVQRQQSFLRFMMRTVQHETQYKQDGSLVAARVSRLSMKA
jgi:hypothetical protein